MPPMEQVQTSAPTSTMVPSYDSSIPWASPDSLKSDFINEIRNARLSDSSSSSNEDEDTVINLKKKLKGE